MDPMGTGWYPGFSLWLAGYACDSCWFFPESTRPCSTSSVGSPLEMSVFSGLPSSPCLTKEKIYAHGTCFLSLLTYTYYTVIHAYNMSVPTFHTHYNIYNRFLHIYIHMCIHVYTYIRHVYLFSLVPHSTAPKKNGVFRAKKNILRSFQARPKVEKRCKGRWGSDCGFTQLGVLKSF